MFRECKTMESEIISMSNTMHSTTAKFGDDEVFHSGGKHLCLNFTYYLIIKL